MDDPFRKLDSNTFIVNVWADNLEEEFARIRQVVEKYPVISMVHIGSLNSSVPDPQAGYGVSWCCREAHRPVPQHL